MTQKKVSFLLEDIPKNLWNKFKSVTTKDKTINEAIIGLIRKKVEREDD